MSYTLLYCYICKSVRWNMAAIILNKIAVNKCRKIDKLSFNGQVPVTHTQKHSDIALAMCQSVPLMKLGNSEDCSVSHFPFLTGLPNVFKYYIKEINTCQPFHFRQNSPTSASYSAIPVIKNIFHFRLVVIFTVFDAIDFCFCVQKS